MKKIKLYCATTLVALFASCSDFGDINVSPNGAVTPLTSALLTNALTAVGGTTANVLPGLYCQYFSETLYTDASRYSVQDVNWSGDLAGSMYDLQNIININTNPSTRAYAALQGSNENQVAIARIVKAYRFSILTDRYGDMPYFEALQENTQPVFDLQEDIYNDIFKELDEAVAQFDDGALVKGDILFGTGNAAQQVAKWQMFANSWRLILALRVSEVDATLGAAQANAALAAEGGIMTSIADNIAIAYPGNAAAFNNPWYGIGADQTVSTTVADFVNSMNDDRKFAFGNTVSGTLTGMDYGLQRQDAIDYSANHPNMSKVILADAFRGQAGSVQLLTYDQVALALSEAYELGWITGGTATDAEDAYDAAITASWARWGQNNAGNLSNYKALAAVDLNLAGSRLDKIRFQRWISFYPNGQQGWSEWRRTGIPALTPSPAPVNTSEQIPVRYIYPTAEYGLNAAKLAEAVGRLDNEDTTDSHVWWDN
jgi:hypothetical protein